MTTSGSLPSAGTSVGPFRIEGPLGAGGMGVVFRARDERLDRSVALKLIAPQTLGDDVARTRLIREARLASALNHPNICTIYEVGESDGRGWIAMELVEGRPLRDLIPPGGLPMGEAIRYAAQIADALGHAHDRGVVHRDLKTANVMVTPEARVKVLDFGLAKRLDDQVVSVAGLSLTTPGTVVGTPHYMPPEVLLGNKADARGDLWALGVVLYEMLAGSLPFRGDTVMVVASSILHAEPPPLPERVPEPMRRLVSKLLAKNPEQRFATAAEVRRELEALASGPISTAALEPPRRRQALWPWVTAATAVAVIAVIGYVGFVRKEGNFAPKPGAPGGFPAPPGAQAGPIRSLAVLPLANLSGDPQQNFFADGMTEELITQLAPIESLKVISRTSVMQYKGTQKTIPQIGKELGVDGIIEGSVLRAGNRVRITAQLIDARADKHLWAESYERDVKDVIALQGEVARDITSKIRLELSATETARLMHHRAVDPEANDLYMRGRYDWSTLSDAGVRRAIAYYEQAIQRDPNDARFYSGMADAYIVLAQVVGTTTFAEALPNVKSFAEKALSLDSTSAEAHGSMAMALLWYDRDWAGAERHARRAIELSPGYASAHILLAAMLSAEGRHAEAYQEGRQALALDPLSIINNHTFAWDLYHARRYDDALAQVRHVSELDPRFTSTYGLRARILERMGRYREAAQNTTAGSLWGLQPQYRDTLVRAAETRGARGYWETQLALSRRPRRDAYRRSDVWLAYIFTGLGERDSAFAALERAYASKEGELLFVKVDPLLDPLRGDPRMKDLLGRMGLVR